MKAWRFHSEDDWRLDDIEEPGPGAEDVVVQVKVVQPSITEVVARDSSSTPLAQKFRTLLSRGEPWGFFGHEFTGVVTAVGESVSRLKTGDRVATFRSSTSCGSCALCASGHSDRCRAGRHVGTDLQGGFAELTSIPEDCLVRVPDSLDDQQAATIQPLAHCAGCLGTSGVQPEDTLLILGQGVLGLGILQLARARGVMKIITTDIREENLELSGQLGSDCVLDATQENLTEVVLENTDGRGADVVVEVAGGNPRYGLAGWTCFGQALELVRDGGRILVASLNTGNLPVEVSLLSRRGLRLLWPLVVPQRYEGWLLSLMDKGLLTTKPMIRKTVKGLEGVPEAFEITANKARYQTINPCQVIL